MPCDARTHGRRVIFPNDKKQTPLLHVRFQPGDFLVFGPETRGLPENLLAANKKSLHQHSDAWNPQPESGYCGCNCAV